MSDDLKALFPGQDVNAGGEQFTITPFKFGQLPRVSKCLAAIAGNLKGGNLVEIAAAGGEELIELVALAVAKPRAWFDSLPMDEGLALIAAVIEVNRDFFVQRMAPILEKLTGALTGAPSSAASSQPVTAGAISPATP